MNINIEPIRAGDFDFHLNRTAFQIRINIWGKLAKLIFKLMFNYWNKHGHNLNYNGEYKAIEFHNSIKSYKYNNKGYLIGYEFKNDKR